MVSITEPASGRLRGHCRPMVSITEPASGRHSTSQNYIKYEVKIKGFLHNLKQKSVTIELLTRRGMKPRGD